MRTHLVRFRKHVLLEALVIVSAIMPMACSRVNQLETAIKAVFTPDPKAAEEAAAPVEPGLFAVSTEQLDHLKVVAARRETWSTVIRTTGTVDWDADHTTQAISQVNGPITRILVDYGTKVNAGDPLLYVSSPDVASAVSAYRKARNREDANKRIVDRQKELLDRGAIAVKDYESSVADYNDSVTDVQSSLQTLKIFGITGEEITQAEQQGKAIATELAVRAPIAGTVVQKLVSPGQLVQAGSTVCFTLTDASTVWIQGHIFDSDLPSVQVGESVDESNQALGKSFQGTLSYIGVFVDPATRTTPVRIVTLNPDGLLKKDMFVDAVIHTQKQNSVLAVPVSAILRDAQNEPMVYVQTEPGKFAERSVQVGSQQHDMIEVSKGLRDGEKVVGDGSLFLQFASTSQ